jgi:large subunit ribosomal protein L35
MPKKKTKKCVAKRCRLSAGGKVLFARPGRGHLLSGRSRKVKRKLRRTGVTGPADATRIRSLLV